MFSRTLTEVLRSSFGRLLRSHYIYAALVVVLVKATIVAVVASVLEHVDVSNTHFVTQKPSPHGWLLPFYGWDSGWYTG